MFYEGFLNWKREAEFDEIATINSETKYAQIYPNLMQ